MTYALHRLENEPVHVVEVIVHISETLGEKNRKDLVAGLEAEQNIVSADFSHNRNHLMLVKYDRDISSSQDVLASIKAKRYNARLIGPV